MKVPKARRCMPEAVTGDGPQWVYSVEKLRDNLLISEAGCVRSRIRCDAFRDGRSKIIYFVFLALD
jgi:hypothetical protein